MRILFATAELAPIARVGGLAEAAAGLTRSLEAKGLDIDIVLPDYDGRPLEAETVEVLTTPSWAAPATARRGRDASGRTVTLVEAPGLARPHPYLDPATGEGWVDNDSRFFAFSAAVAALCELRRPDLVHLNDWHTALVPALWNERRPTVFTIHTIGYQGHAAGEWLERLHRGRDAYEWFGGINPVAGALALADRVIAVSPNYAREIRTPEGGVGLHERLRALGDRLSGIRNGIDTATWDPASDEKIAAPFDFKRIAAKGKSRDDLCDRFGWPHDTQPIIGMVTRLAEQKGVDIALSLAPYLELLPARMVLLGAGDKALAASAVAARSDRLAFVEGFDDELGHRIFAGSDLFLMPSRFEPCGLAQMQAMAYGTIPVTTDVGGLHDTVIDDDRSRGEGNGFSSLTVDDAGLIDALHRAVRALRHAGRRKAIQRRGMTTDWSWSAPADEHIDLYKTLT